MGPQQPGSAGAAVCAECAPHGALATLHTGKLHRLFPAASAITHLIVSLRAPLPERPHQSFLPQGQILRHSSPFSHSLPPSTRARRSRLPQAHCSQPYSSRRLRISQPPGVWPHHCHQTSGHESR